MTTAADDGEDADRRVLAPDEGDRALEDRAGDGLHLGGAGVARQHVAGQVDGEQHGDDPGQQDDQLERTRIHQGRRVLHGVDWPASVPWRVRVRRRGRVSGELPAGPVGMHRGWDLAGRRRVYRGADRRVKPDRGPRICSRPARPGPEPVGRRPRTRGPYTPGLVSQRPALGCLFEIVETLVLTLIIFLVIQNFVAQPYKVQQQSMERTLEPEQYVLVDKLTPRFDTYKRGDIVVFKPPADWGDDGTPFIKRVIGEAGDTVEIRDDGLVYVNDIALDEPYVYSDEHGGPPQATTAAARPGELDDRRRRALPDGRPPLELGRLAHVRPGRGRPGHRAGVAALLAARHVRHPADARPTRTSPRPLPEPVVTTR